MNSTETIAFIDESGWLGFAENSNDINSFGVIAGLIIPKRNLEAMTKFVRDNFAHMVTDFEKLHSRLMFTDNSNQELRSKVLNWILSQPELIIFSSSLYANAVAQENIKNKALFKNPKENSKYKISKNQHRPKIYFEILDHILVKLDTICEETESTAELVFDRLDKSEEKNIHSNLLDLQTSTKKKNLTAFNTATKKVETRSIESSFLSENFDNTIKHLKVLKMDESYEQYKMHLLVADIIVNTLNAHLTEKIKQCGPTLRLNSNKALDGYILKPKMVYINDKDIIDTIYSNSV